MSIISLVSKVINGSSNLLNYYIYLSFNSKTMLADNYKTKERGLRL